MAIIKVINVEPRDICVTFEMSIGAIEMVLEALDHAIIEIDTKDEKLVAANEFLKDGFFKTLNGIVKEVKGDA